MTSREEVFGVVSGERDYQESVTLRHNDDVFSSGDLIVMLQFYADELTRDWTMNKGSSPSQVGNTMRKIAAIAVRYMESYGAIPREVEGVGKWGQVSQSRE